MLIRSLLALTILTAAAVAQPPEPGRGRGRFGAEGGFPDGGLRGARFLGAEAGMPGRIVKNAPFSADIVTETTQTLPDGNHIRQTNTVRVYRDNEGRTRSEQSLRNLNGLAPNSNLPSVVFINDPVAGANYALNSNNRTATRTAWTRPQNGGSGGQRSERPGFRQAMGGQNVKTESLGKQTIEGVPADGTRTTLTIPAGQIGNEQPIQVVTESWYSADLKTVILSKRSDPRAGDTVTRYTNVTRSEPAHTMFEVPADFKVSESVRGGRGTNRQ